MWVAFFSRVCRDAAVLGVAFLRRYGQEHGEIGCLAIHHVYRKVGVDFLLLCCLCCSETRYSIRSSIAVHSGLFSTIVCSLPFVCSTCKRGWGEAMLSYLERVAIASSIKHVFVLSSRTMQWFVERGFDEAEVSDLPEERAR